MGLSRRNGFWLWTGGPVPRGSAAITLGPVVIVRTERAASARLLRHELVHVEQYRRMGALRFLVTYLFDYLRWRARGYPHRGAYRRISHEVEAYWREREHTPPERVPQTPEESAVPPA